MTIKIRSYWLVLWLAIALTVAYNGSLWHGLFETRSTMTGDDLLFLLSCAFFLTALFNLLLSIFAFKGIQKPLLIILILASAAASFFMDSYGIFIDSDMIQNVLQTDHKEAFELFDLAFIGHMLLWGIGPAWLIYKMQIQYATPIRQSLINLASGLLSLLVIALIAAFFYQDYASTFRNHREFRYLINPTNYLYAVQKVIRNQFKQDSASIIPITAQVSLGQIATQKQRRTITIFVVGETARAQQFHLNGYSRQTTPLLEQDNIISFKQATSCGTATATSLPCMFSRFSRKDYDNDKGHQYENLLDVIKASGISVLWRDNNSGCKGVCNRVPHEDVSHLDIPKLCNKQECFDEVLLHQLDRIIHTTDRDMFIVLHQKGSHGPAYYRRVPERFRTFVPVCQTSELQKCTRQEIVNAYDNTIFYTDYVLDKVIKLLQSYPALNTAMLYMSDHGESLGEKNMYLHGAPYFIAPDEQTHVPLILWVSDNMLSDYKLDRHCIENQVNSPVSHDNLFHSFLGLLNILSPDNYQSKLDIFATCRIASQK